jgi:hypothetical protein
VACGDHVACAGDGGTKWVHDGHGGVNGRMLNLAYRCDDERVV